MTIEEQLAAWFAGCRGYMHVDYRAGTVTIHDEAAGLEYMVSLEPADGLTQRLKAALAEAKHPPAQAKGAS